MRCVLLQHDVFSQELPIPQLPGKAHFSLPTQPPHISRVPQADTSALNAVERSRLVLDQTHARELDRQLHQVKSPSSAFLHTAISPLLQV